jgi:hypothetical protein
MEKLLMLDSIHPFSQRRESLGLSLSDVQQHLSRQGFNYSIDMIRAFEQGERGYPVQNTGFMLAMSQCLDLPVSSIQQTARQTINSARTTRMYYRRVEALRPQNRYLLDFVLRHPNVTRVPGFNFWFEAIKTITLQLPDDWFRRK